MARHKLAWRSYYESTGGNQMKIPDNLKQEFNDDFNAWSESKGYKGTIKEYAHKPFYESAWIASKTNDFVWKFYKNNKLGKPDWSGEASSLRWVPTFENGRVVLCEDLEDKSYWADKQAKEFAQYWSKLSVFGKINHKIRSNYRSLKWKFIYKFRRKWLAEQMCAPLKTPRSYIAIARKTILVDKIPEREPTQFIE